MKAPWVKLLGRTAPGHLQQIHGSCSPASQFTMRVATSWVFIRTKQRGSPNTCPTMAASWPLGCACMTVRNRWASSGGQMAINLTSFATYNGSSPNNSQALLTSALSGKPHVVAALMRLPFKDLARLNHLAFTADRKSLSMALLLAKKF